MIKVLLAGVEQAFEKGPRTLGELLNLLQARSGVQGCVMTAVRIDGVDQPTFGDPATWSAPLDAVRLVEVDIAPLGRLLLSSLDQASGSLQCLVGAAEELAEAFRASDVSPAQQYLAEFAQSLSSLVLIMSTVAQAAAVDLATITADGMSAMDAIRELSEHGAALIRSRDGDDWIALADKVQYEVGPSLRRWLPLIDQIRQSVSATVSTAA